MRQPFLPPTPRQSWERRHALIARCLFVLAASFAITALVAGYCTYLTRSARGDATHPVEAPQPWKREPLVGRIEADSTPWGGGPKTFVLVTMELPPNVKHTETLSFASDADYKAAERHEGMVCDVTAVRARRGYYQSWLVVESIQGRK